jgi:hypothetical protein
MLLRLPRQQHDSRNSSTLEHTLRRSLKQV